MPKRSKAKLTTVGPGGSWTYAFRSSIFPDGQGRHTMMVNKAMQAGVRARPSQAVKVAMEPDTAPRVVTVPAALKKAYVEFITEAKQADPRARRVEKTLAMLARQEKRM